MPMIAIDPAQELRELNELLDSDPILKRKFEADQREYEFRLNLARARKQKNLTQNRIEEETGLTQQAISRIEKGSRSRSPTLNTLLRYLDAIDCDLTITARKY